MTTFYKRTADGRSMAIDFLKYTPHVATTTVGDRFRLHLNLFEIFSIHKNVYFPLKHSYFLYIFI